MSISPGLYGQDAESDSQGISGLVRYTEAEARSIHARLMPCSVEELGSRFSSGVVPTFSEIRGRTAGEWLAKSPEDYWWAKWFIKVFLDSSWARWTGKGFFTPFGAQQRGRGANLFNNGILPIRYKLATYLKPAEMDGNPCLCLRYPFGSLMYGLIDDVRKIEPGVFLGQMLYKFPWLKQRVFIGYFVLCALKTEQAA